MTRNITELVDEPELIDAADDVSIDRWTKYGHDRLYINGARVEPYIDLEDGTVGDTGMVRVDVEFDGDVVTVEIGREDDHSRHDVIVISLSGDVSEDGKEEEKTEDANEVDESDEVSTDEDDDSENLMAELLDDEFGEASVGTSGKCLHVDCDKGADVAVKCDTGQIKHYCDEHHGGRRAGHALIVEEKRLTELADDDDLTDNESKEEKTTAEPTAEHVEEVGYNKAAGQAQQIEAQRLITDGGTESPQPVAQLHNGVEMLTLYDDGEYVIAGEGDVYCSEHGDLRFDDIAASQCDHDEPSDGKDLPTIDIADIPGFLLESSEVEKAAAQEPRVIERVAEEADLE